AEAAREKARFCDPGHRNRPTSHLVLPLPGAEFPRRHRETPGKNKGSTVMIRTAIISVAASFVLFGVWTANLVSYHPATDLNPLAPLSTTEWR
ncbi:MAG: hypothetical protein WA905_19295, partial [Pseudolabrys sp.]